MTWKKPSSFMFYMNGVIEIERIVYTLSLTSALMATNRLAPVHPQLPTSYAHNKPHSWSNTTYVLQTSCMSSSKSLLIFTVETWEFWATRPTLRHWRWWCPPWSWTQLKFRSMERAQEKLIVVGVELDSTQDLALLRLLGEPGSRAMYDHI